VSDFWRKYVGRSGAVVGIDRFGESAPAGDLFSYFGFTPERVVEAVKSVLERASRGEKPRAVNAPRRHGEQING
jgi:pyruvate dehydrogenase complex dehydrogenase (E1) component